MQIDGLAEQLTPARLHATPGVHSITIRSPKLPIRRRDVVVEGGKSAEMDVAEEPAPVVAAPAPAPAPVVEAPKERIVTVEKSDLRRTAGFVVMGVGGAVVLSGVILGVQTLGARDVYYASPSTTAVDHANAMMHWTNVALIAGGVLVAGGAGLVVGRGRTPRMPRSWASRLCPAERWFTGNSELELQRGTS